MNVVRWRPLRELNSMQREMNRVFDSFFREGDDVSTSTWYPTVDIKETTETVEIYAELPGINKEDIKIAIRDNTLSLSGEKKSVEEEKDTNYHRVERAYGTFSRSFALPAKINQAKISAVFTDGVLQITLPKAEEEKPRHIEIS